jgi:uncharacterized protein (DUF2141 family)
MNKYLLNTSIIIIFLYLLFGSCAQPGTLTGGVKDTLPPIPIKFAPVFGRTHFASTKISIKFNEYFDLSDIHNQFFVSPPLKAKPDIKSKGKYLEIRLKEELDSNTTYNFDFNDAIKDFTEGNILHGFQYVCSTGDVVDSLKVRGKVLDAQTQVPVEGVFVFLYRNLIDTTPSKQLPNFLGKTNKNGQFEIRNIAQGNYYIFALNDLNTNLKYDQANEFIAFENEKISPSVSLEMRNDTIIHDSIVYNRKKQPVDTIKLREIKPTLYYNYLPDSIPLYLFNENNANQFIVKSKRDMPGKINFKLNRTISSDFKIEPLNFNANPTDFLLEWNENNDSVNYWIKNPDYRKMDTILFKVTYLHQDTLNNWVITADTIKEVYNFNSTLLKPNERKDAIIKAKPSEFKFETTNINQQFLDINQNIKFKSTIPIDSLDKNYITLYQIADTLMTKYTKIITGTGKYLNPESDGITSAILKSNSQMQVIFKNEKSNNWAIKPLNFNLSTAAQILPNNTNDTLNVRFNANDVATKDTLKLVFSYNVKTLVGEQPFADTLFLAVEKSIYEVYGETVAFNLIATDISNRNYELSFDGNNNGMDYRLIISPKFATDIFGNRPDSLFTNFTIHPDDYYGNLIVNLQNQPQNLYYVLTNEKEVKIKEFEATGEDKLTIKLLAPGNYLLRAFVDENKNKKWDTGDFFKRKQPEKVYLYNKKLIIRSAWDTEEDWDMSK